MIRLPKLTKGNWRKVLRELDESKYPSLPVKLKQFRDRLNSKDKLIYAEQIIGYALMKKYFEEFSREINATYLDMLEYSKFDKKAPLEHQKEAVEFLIKNNRCILADTMGKGKTLSAIYAALSLADTYKTLIVTTKSLKYNFVHELKIFTDDYIVIDNEFRKNRFIIIHYNVLKKYENDIINFNPDIIIADECHLVKNLKSVRGKTFQNIVTKVNPVKLWLMTGTPISNRPSEFYTHLKLIKHPVANNWQKYVIRYCEGYQNDYGVWVTKGASNLKELHDLTKDVVLRRVHEKGDLPDYERIPYRLQLTSKDRKRYDEAIKDYAKIKFKEFDTNLFNSLEAEEMVKLSLWRQFCALNKTTDGSLETIISDELDSDKDAKIVIFTNFTKVVDTIYEKYKDVALLLDGRISSSEERQNLVDEFNNNPNYKLFICNLKVGGVGYNIQSANIVIMSDMDWVPDSMLQGEARIWRFGQKRNCKFIYPLYEDTVEEILYRTIESKMKVISELIEGKIEGYFEDVDETKIVKTKKEDILAEIFAQMNLVS